MVPAEASVAELARTAFADRALLEFTDRYYAADPEDPLEDKYWHVRDSEDDDAPHTPVSLTYDARLACFVDIAEVADVLIEGQYTSLASCIAARFVEPHE